MTIFSRVAARHIAMDMIVQNVASEGRADISFTVPRDELPATLKAVEDAVKELHAEGYSYDDDVAKISVVGLGMATQPGVAEKMFRSLAERGINIQMITTSEIKISVLVAREFAQEALRTVHEAFHLEKPPAEAHAAAAGPRPSPTATASHARPAQLHGEADHRGHHVGRDAGPGHHGRTCPTSRAWPPRSSTRWPKRGFRGHDRAERGTRESGEHLVHRAAGRNWTRP